MGRIARNFMVMCFILVLLTLSFSTATAVENKYPVKPITIVLPYPPGGGTDAACRALAKEMQRLLGQPILVESRPGAAGIIAGDYVAKAEPDGYTIGAFTTTAADPELYSQIRKASYTIENLIPVVKYIVFSYALVSKKDAPWKNLHEFVKYVKDNPNKVTWGHLGIGHHYQLCGSSLLEAEKLSMRAVPFKGGADVVVAVLGGHIDVGFSSAVGVQDHIQSGKMIALAMQHPERVSYMPNVPTFKELGYNLEVTPHYLGLFVPKGTPEDVVKKIHDAVKRATETPYLKDYANKMAFDLSYGSKTDLINCMKEDRKVIGRILLKNEFLSQLPQH